LSAEKHVVRRVTHYLLKWAIILSNNCHQSLPVGLLNLQNFKHKEQYVR